VVEQGTHKPLVGGSNPPSATTAPLGLQATRAPSAGTSGAYPSQDASCSHPGARQVRTYTLVPVREPDGYEPEASNT
jgi:hypothetical protein